MSVTRLFSTKKFNFKHHIMNLLHQMKKIEQALKGSEIPNDLRVLMNAKYRDLEEKFHKKSIRLNDRCQLA